MKTAVAIVATLVLLTTTFSRLAFADDPCSDSKTAVSSLTDYMSGWAQMGASHGLTGTFTVAPRNKGNTPLWYEITYSVGKDQEVQAVIRNLAPLEGRLTVSASGPTLSLTYSYGATSQISCGYRITPTQNGFKFDGRQL